MSQVDSDGDALGVSRLGQDGDVEELTGVILDPGDQEDGDRVSLLFDQSHHVFLANQTFTLCASVGRLLSV